MTTRLHIDEIPTDLTLAQRLITAQFPQWAALPLAPVTAAGTDHALYRLGDNMVMRLPRTARAAAQADKEKQWLPYLAPHLPLAIPQPLAHGLPDAGYPLTWSVYRWLEGDNATAQPVDDLAQAAVDLARFLAALRAIPAHAGPPPGQHNFGRGVPLITRDAAVRAALAALPDLVDVDRATAAWEAACHAPPWAEPPVWIHGDLTPGNLLVWQGHLHAAIDFGGLAVGDPACDLMVAWNLLDSATRPILRAHLAIDHASWLRGMGWALSMALIALPYYRHTNLPIVPLSFRVLDEILNDPNLRAELRAL
jgi:aminoglycoside phosphotransferase (APT) family kinase protein